MPTLPPACHPHHCLCRKDHGSWGANHDAHACRVTCRSRQTLRGFRRTRSSSRWTATPCASPWCARDACPASATGWLRNPDAASPVHAVVTGPALVDRKGTSHAEYLSVPTQACPALQSQRPYSLCSTCCILQGSPVIQLLRGRAVCPVQDRTEPEKQKPEAVYYRGERPSGFLSRCALLRHQ